MPTPNLQNINLPEGSGIPAVGSLLSILNLAVPAVYVPIGNLGNMKWGLKILDADTTNQGTVWKQGIPTLRDGNAITGDLHLIPSSPGDDGGIMGHSFIDGVGSIAINADVRQYRLVWPDGAGMFFSAYITEFPIDMQVEKDLLSNMSFKVTGPPTFFDVEPGGVTPQVITFGAQSAKTTSSPPFSVFATSDSGLTVKFRITSGPATITGNLVTLNGTAGSVVITAYQQGNGTYAAATPVPETVVVS